MLSFFDINWAKMVQWEQVLAYLRLYGSITDNQARDDLGINRLSDVVFKLRTKRLVGGMNWNVLTEDTEATNRFNKTIFHATYTMGPASMFFGISEYGLENLKTWVPRYIQEIREERKQA